MKAWLWPDRVIGKRASAQLREEHNAAVNVAAELLAALEAMAEHEGERQYSGIGTEHDSDALEAAKARARAALAKARGA